MKDKLIELLQNVPADVEGNIWIRPPYEEAEKALKGVE